MTLKTGDPSSNTNKDGGSSCFGIQFCWSCIVSIHSRSNEVVLDVNGSCLSVTVLGFHFLAVNVIFQLP